MHNADEEVSGTVFFAKSDHIDMKALIALIELQEQTGTNLLERVVELFISGTPEQLEIMRSAVNLSNPVILFELAHKLKSSSAVLGAMKLSSLFQELELIGRQNALENAKTLLHKTEVEYKNVENILNSILRKVKTQGTF